MPANGSLAFKDRYLLLLRLKSRFQQMQSIVYYTQLIEFQFIRIQLRTSSPA